MSHAKGRIAAVVTSVVAIVALSNIPATAADQLEATTSTTLPANSVTSTTVVNGSLYQQDINPSVVGVLRTPKQNSVTGWSIKDGTVGLSDLTPSVQGQVTHGRLTDVDQVRSYVTWAGDQGTVLKMWDILCPAGKIAISGGYFRNGGAIEALKGVQIITSTPIRINQDVLPTRWLIEGFNNSNVDMDMGAYVYCGRLS
jgi:hypothetical protein